jgi:sigma-B regulation protein RsbU (phosphoserine phosphatase)
MDQLIPSLNSLLAPLAAAFRTEVFALFRCMVAAWTVCLGRRTISRVWETTGQAQQRHHAAAYRLFSQAVWNFDEVARLLLVRLLAVFVPVILAGGAEPSVLHSSGFPVGVLEQAEYEGAEVRLRPGDRFWLYSDGLLEAMNPAGEQFGKGRLFTELHAASADALSGAVRKVLRRVESWAGEQGPQDDISLVAFEIDRS